MVAANVMIYYPNLNKPFNIYIIYEHKQLPTWHSYHPVLQTNCLPINKITYFTDELQYNWKIIINSGLGHKVVS